MEIRVKIRNGKISKIENFNVLVAFSFFNLFIYIQLFRTRVFFSNLKIKF